MRKTFTYGSVGGGGGNPASYPEPDILPLRCKVQVSFYVRPPIMIGHPNIPSSVRQFLAEISADNRVESLILFGSRAVGDHEERSDIDIAVCGRAITRLDWARLRAAAYEANTLYWVSLVHYDRNPPVLKARIRETGVEIYVQTQTE